MLEALVSFRLSDSMATGVSVNTCRTGFGIGAFFSLMSASFAYEDPYLRAQSQTGMNTSQKASQFFKEMGKGMWTSGKSFGKIGALFAGVECVIESVSLAFQL